MDTQSTLNTQPIPTIPTPAAPPIIPAPQPPKSPFFPIILTLLVLIFASISGYLYLQSRSLRAQLPPSPTPAPSIVVSSSADPTANWNIFTDPAQAYQFRYPSAFQLSSIGERPLLNKNIIWYESNYNHVQCHGDCPVVDSSTNIQLGDNLQATKVSGWIGGIGGSTPQSYVKYEIKYPNKSKYFIIELWELPQELLSSEKQDPNRKPGLISQEQINIFDQILSTFQFTN